MDGPLWATHAVVDDQRLSHVNNSHANTQEGPIESITDSSALQFHSYQINLGKIKAKFNMEDPIFFLSDSVPIVEPMNDNCIAC